jgi:hypothetical protein
MHRSWGKPDANQAAIVAALRKVGVSVLITSALGNGRLDLVCSWHGRVTFVEVKKPGEKLRASQVAWVAAWDPFANIAVVETAVDAIDAVCR